MSRRNHNLFDEPNPSSSESSRLFASMERERKKKNRKFCCLFAIISVTTIVILIVIMGVSIGLSNVVNQLPKDPYDRAVALLTEYPLIDG